MSSEKSIKKNYIYNLTYQILLIMAPLITTPIVSRSLTAEGVGTYGYIYSIVSYFVMISILGSSTFGQREVSFVQSDTHKRSVVFYEIFLFRVLTCSICSIAYITFATLQPNNKSIYLVMTFFVLTVATDVSWFFQGVEEFGKIIRRSIVVKIINIVLIIFFVREQSDLFLYACFLSIVPCLGNIVLWFCLPNYIHRIKFKEMDLVYVLKQSFALFVPTLAIQIYTVLDKTMIGIITKEATENGYYEQAEKISKMSVAIVTSLSTVMIPRIGYLFAHNERELLYKSMYRSYRFTIFVCVPLCVGVATTAGNLVPWFLGEGYGRVIPLLKVLSLLILALGISNITGMQYMIPTKRQKQYTISVTTGAIINLICNSFMIYYWNSMGAAIASVISEFFVTVIQLYMVRNEISAVFIFKQGIKYIIAGVIMGIILVIEARFLAPKIFNTILMIITGVFVYGIVLFIIKDEFLYQVLNSVKQRIHRKDSLKER